MKKVIMSIAEEEREGQGSNEPPWIHYVDFSNVTSIEFKDLYK